MKPMTDDEVRTVQLSVLRKFADLCDESGIDYFLTAGTLLGAIRHNGYIPWDDDIDVAMTREGYERFFSQVEPTLGKRTLRLLSPKTVPDYTIPVIKLIDSRTVTFEANRSDLRSGVGIDIFVLDDISGGLFRAKLIFHRRHVIRTLLSVRRPKTQISHTPLRRAAIGAARALLHPIPARTLAQKLLAPSESTDGRTTFVAILNDLYGVKTRLKRDVFETHELHKFEDGMYRIPAGWRTLLTSFYGDYMTLPSPEHQVSHHVSESYFLDNP